MTYGQIIQEIKKGLRVGGNLTEVYLKRFRENYKGDRLAIETFKAHYTDDGKGVVFTYTINGKDNNIEIPTQRGRDFE